MPKYLVIGIIAADVSCEVEAENADEAEDKGSRQMATPTLCYHCSRLFELGDIYEYQVKLLS